MYEISMEEIKAKKFIKLGTSIRYLIDVKYKMSDKHTADEPLGDNHVIDNINHVLTLVSELGLTGTVESGAFGKLRKLHDELTGGSRTNTHINLSQAECLSEISRIIRGSLLSEGNNKLAYYLEQKEIDSVKEPGWPKDVTMYLALNAPKNIRKLAYWLVGGAFAAGVAFGETGITVNFFNSFNPQSQETKNPKMEQSIEQDSSNLDTVHKANQDKTEQQ